MQSSEVIHTQTIEEKKKTTDDRIMDIEDGKLTHITMKAPSEKLTRADSAMPAKMLLEKQIIHIQERLSESPLKPKSPNLIQESSVERDSNLSKSPFIDQIDEDESDSIHNLSKQVPQATNQLRSQFL